MDAQVTDSWIGRTLGGRYEIIEIIGEGGMGVVYRAKQLSVDREVAIKMMHMRAAQDPQWSDRFQSEAKACSLLTHPNTIRLYDFGKTTLGNFYMVMELLDGKSLTDAIAAEAPMGAARVLRILMQCCASLSEAHKAGIIHRDIKPDNIIVQSLEGASDFIKLIDFSIAKRSNVAMTAAGMIMGTPQFMSPEQGRGEEIDLRSDLYSLGIVAYFMLVGRLPFHHEDAIEVLRMHQSMEVPPIPESIPSSVSMLIMSCLDKNKSRRPASALALLEACKIWLTELDPTLDVASDPILKNTLVSTGPTESMDPPQRHTLPQTSVPAPAATVKTMLGASGAFAANLPRARAAAAVSPSIVETTPLTPSPAAAVARAAASEAADSKRTLVRDLHRSGAATTSASASLGDTNRTLLRDPGVSESKGTAIQSSSGPQLSESEEPRREESLRNRGTNRPTVNEFSGSPRPNGVMQAVPAPPSGPQPGPAMPQYGANEAQAVISAPSYSGQLAVPVQASRTSFLFACLLVAITFGFGAYFLTSTLR